MLVYLELTYYVYDLMNYKKLCEFVSLEYSYDPFGSPKNMCAYPGTFILQAEQIFLTILVNVIVSMSFCQDLSPILHFYFSNDILLIEWISKIKKYLELYYTPSLSFDYRIVGI